MSSSCPVASALSHSESEGSPERSLTCPEPWETKLEAREGSEDEAAEAEADWHEDDVPSLPEEENSAAPACLWARAEVKAKLDPAAMVGMNRKEWDSLAAKSDSTVPYKWIRGILLHPSASAPSSAAPAPAVPEPPAARPPTEAVLDWEWEDDDEEPCSICWMPFKKRVVEGRVERNDFVLNCGHSFCEDCVSSVVRLGIHDKSTIERISCPAKGCDVLIDRQAIARILSEQEFARYDHDVQLAALSRNPNLRYCPRPTCSAMVLDASPLQPRSECLECAFEFCFFCLHAWHGMDTTCMDYAKTLRSQPGAEENERLLMDAWMEENWAVKKCPRCMVPIAKTAGCKHMTCSACKHDFCWRCLERFTKEHYTCQLDDRRIDAFGRFVSLPTFYERHAGAAAQAFYPKGCSPKEREAALAKLVRDVAKKKKKRNGRKRRGGLLGFGMLMPALVSRRKHAAELKSQHDALHVTILGGSGCGKSCLAKRFFEHFFDDEWDFEVDMSFQRQLEAGLALEVLDTTGQEEFSALRDQWVRGAEAFIVGFKAGQHPTLVEAKAAIQLVLRVKDCDVNEVAILLVGFGADQHPDFADDLAPRELAASFGIPLIYTSALEDYNVEEAFGEIVRLGLHHREVRRLRAALHAPM